MATYIQGITDYLPQIQPFQPDYNFLSNILQTKQSRYDAAHKQLSSIYGTMLNSPMMRDQNITARDNFFKMIDQDIQKMSNLDLSLQQNADAAQQIFKGLYEDKNIVKDMTWTKNWMNKREKGQMLKNCTDPNKCGGTWWEGGDRYLDYKAQEFKNATEDEALSFEDVDYIAAQPIMEKAMKLAKDSGFNIKWDEIQGDWIIHHKNGSQLTTPLAQYYMATFGSDPKIMAYKNAQAYVTRKDWVGQNLSNYADENEANVAYIANMYENAKNNIVEKKKVVDDVKSSLESEKDLLAQQIKSGGYFSTDSFNDSYNALNQDYEVVTQASDVYKNADEALKAYGINRDNLKASLKYFDSMVGFDMLSREALSAASAYANLTSEQTMDVNPYAKMAKEQSFEMQKLHEIHGYRDPNTGEYIPGLNALEKEYAEKVKAQLEKDKNARKDYLTGATESISEGAQATTISPDLTGAWQLSGDFTKGKTILDNNEEISRFIRNAKSKDKTASEAFIQKLYSMMQNEDGSGILTSEITNLINKIAPVATTEKAFKELAPYREVLKEFKKGDPSKLIEFLNDPNNSGYSDMFMKTMNTFFGANAKDIDKVRFRNLYQALNGDVSNYQNQVEDDKAAIEAIAVINNKNIDRALVAEKARMDNLSDSEYKDEIKFKGNLSEEALKSDKFSSLKNMSASVLRDVKVYNRYGNLSGVSTDGKYFDPISFSLNTRLQRDLKTWAKENAKYFSPRRDVERTQQRGFSGQMAESGYEPTVQEYYRNVSPEEEAYYFARNVVMNSNKNMISYINEGNDKDVRNIRAIAGGKTTGYMAAPYKGTFRSDKPDQLVDESIRNINLNKNASDVMITFGTESNLSSFPESSSKDALGMLDEIMNEYIDGTPKGKNILQGNIEVLPIPAGKRGYTAIKIVPSNTWVRERTQIPQSPNRPIPSNIAPLLSKDGVVVYIPDNKWQGDFIRKSSLSAVDVRLKAGQTVVRKNAGGEVSMRVLNNGQNYVEITKNYFDPETKGISNQKDFYVLNQDITPDDFLNAYQNELSLQGQFVTQEYYNEMAKYGSRVKPDEQ